MVLVRSRTRAALSYIDELLANFSVHPQKSTQFVLQRLLITCGSGDRYLAVHAANTLLAAAGVAVPPAEAEPTTSTAPVKPATPPLEVVGLTTKPIKKRAGGRLSETHARQLIFFILQFASEGVLQKSRSAAEIKGGDALFNCLVDSCDSMLAEAAKASKPQLIAFVETLFNKFFYEADSNNQQCAFLCSLSNQRRLVEGLVEESLLRLFNRYQGCVGLLPGSDGPCPLRTEFIIRILSFYCEGHFPNISTESICPFVGNVLLELRGNQLAQQTVQPLFYAILAKSRNVSALVSRQSLRSQAALLVEQEGHTKLQESFTNIFNEMDHTFLSIVLLRANPEVTDSLPQLREYMEAYCPRDVYFSAKSVALLLLRLSLTICKELGEEDENGRPIDVSQRLGAVVLVEYIKERVPTISWSEVFDHLDDPNFRLPFALSFRFLMEALQTAFKDQAFPIEKLYRKWKNAQAQRSFLARIVENPEILCLRDYPHRDVETGSLKNPPDENPFVANWRCLDLTEALLNIATNRETCAAVKDVFISGVKHCPDVILLALFQIPPPITPFRNEMVALLLATLIPAHPNAVSVLNVGWNSEIFPKRVIQGAILSSFVAFFQRGHSDPQKLARILDLAHELKPGGLTALLASDDLGFAIQLACLAFKRDYLNLDKWLISKLVEQKETFITVLLFFLDARLPASLVTASSPSEYPLPDDIYLTLLNFCHQHTMDLNPSHMIRTSIDDIFSRLPQIMKESGRSSSVSSTGRASLSNFPPHPDPRIGRQQQPQQQGHNFQSPSLNAAPSFNPIANYLQQPQSQSSGNPVGLGNMFGSNSFGGSQEFLKSAGSSMGGHLQSSFGGAQPQPFLQNFGTSSPTSQLGRPTGMPQPPQRQNSSSSSWSLPGTAPSHRPSGPPTPSQQMDFRAQIPPTGAQTEFQARQQPAVPMSDDLSQMTFADDIQDEANSYFEQIYNPAALLTVGELIERLKRFRVSPNARDQKILNCVVKNLFEEYKFFDDYPDRELRTTAEVYGGIIREGVVSNLYFATAVRKVIEALSADPSSKLWTFGIVSLDHCRTKLCSYPKVCSMIQKLDNFNRFPLRLQEFVTAGMKGEHPPPSVEGRGTPPIWQSAAQRSSSADSTKSGGGLPANRTGNSVLSYTNVDTLVAATEKEGAEVAQPSEAVVDKMSFLFNNLSHANIASKKEEVLSLISEHGEPFIRWLAQYIVMKRVSIEQNFQPLYNTFVQAIDHPLLDKHIKKETFRNIRILLRSDKRQAASNYSDRQLLKNLGLWLGSITISRSKPILIHELDLKSLLMEAYYKGQQELLFVVPFIAKILLACGKTPIFGASCAWIRSILKILAELHNEPDLKINLKFEIEVLCKELNVELQMLPLEGVLKDTDRLTEVKQQLSELQKLGRPDLMATSASPVPSQMRLVPETMPPLGGSIDNKPGTPAPETEQTAAQAEATQQGHFAYHDITVVSYDGLGPHIQIKQTLTLFQLHPQLKQTVRPALVFAIKELIGAVAERAQKIAMTATESVIRKDFALDPDENNMKTSAFHMMRAMTAGMAMITCRDPLGTTMLGHLQHSFQQGLKSTTSTPEQVKMIEEAAQVIAQDNVELATNFIVKTACEKATMEMEKRLETEYQRRIAARREGSRWGDEAVEKIQATLPARIAVAPGATSKELLEIYQQFSSRICGFKPTSVDDSVQESRQLPPPDEKQCELLTAQLNTIIKEVDSTMNSQPNVTNKAFQAVGAIRDLLSQLANNPRDSSVLVNYINKSVEHLLHAFHVDINSKNHLDIEWPRRLRDLFVGVTRVLLGWLPLPEISKRITAAFVQLNVDYKWNVEAMEVLVKQNFLQLPVLDQHIAIKMNGGSNLEATMFAQRFFRALGGGDAAKCSMLKEFMPATYESLLKVHQMQSSSVRGAVPPVGEGAGGGQESPMPADLLGMNREEGEISQKVVESILREWISLCYTSMAQRAPQEALSQMINTMHEHGVLSTDEKVSTFFRMCTEMCVDVTQRMVKQDPGTSFNQSAIIRQRCYYTLDAFVKLISLMIKYSDGTQVHTKITLLKKVLSIVTSVLHLDHEVRRNDFNPMPYHRILIVLFNELTAPEGNTTLELISWNILEAFGQALFVLQPRRCPGFAYAWLDIVGHRNFIGRLLGGAPENPESVKMAAMYTQLIICHLKFLAPFLRNIQLPKSLAVLYKGTLRVLLVILHDFPELLCEFHYVICDTIPPNCVQLRNLVLSAYPRSMRLPDPFALNFKQVDAIADMAVEPKSNLNMATIIPDSIRHQLDEYLATRTAVDFLTALPGLLQVSQTPGSKYNTTVMNAVVLYVGIRAIESLHERRQPINIHTIAHTSFMDIFQNLAVQLCTEGRYLLFNAIANQLRYPNAHTHYFSCVFLFLFLNSDCDAIQEQITRILFERLVALRPHPWGLLITFIELIKNPAYNFWKFEFTRCAPEIERLFQNVANTCVASRPPATGGSEPPRA